MPPRIAHTAAATSTRKTTSPSQVLIQAASATRIAPPSVTRTTRKADGLVPEGILHPGLPFGEVARLGIGLRDRPVGVPKLTRILCQRMPAWYSPKRRRRPQAYRMYTAKNTMIHITSTKCQ